METLRATYDKELRDIQKEKVIHVDVQIQKHYTVEPIQYVDVQIWKQNTVGPTIYDHLSIKYIFLLAHLIYV